MRKAFKLFLISILFCRMAFALDVDTGSFVSPTSAATDTTVSLSFDPKGVSVSCTLRTATGEGTSAYYSIGFSDGTTEGSVNFGEWDAQGNSKAETKTASNIVNLIAADSGSDFLVGNATLGTGEFIIDWSTVSASGRYCMWSAYGGTDIDVDVGTFNSPTTAGTVGITTGHDTDILMVVGAKGTTSDNNIAFGATDKTNQASIATWSDDLQNLTNTTRYQTQSHTVTIINDTTIVEQADYDSSTSTTITLDFVTANATAYPYWYMSINGVNAEVGSSLQQATATQREVNLTGAFQPSIINTFTIGYPTAEDSVAAHGRFQTGYGTSTTNRYSNSYFSADNQSTTSSVSSQFREDYVIALVDVSEGFSTTGADIHSIDTDGFHYDWTVVDGNARYIYHIAIGEEAAAPAPTTTGRRILNI